MCSQCGSQYIRPFLKGWPGHSSFTMVNLSFFVHSIVWVVNRALVWMIFDLLPIMRCPRLSCQVTDKPALHEMSTFREARGYQTEDFFEMFQTTPARLPTTVISKWSSPLWKLSENSVWYPRASLIEGSFLDRLKYLGLEYVELWLSTDGWVQHSVTQKLIEGSRNRRRRIGYGAHSQVIPVRKRILLINFSF